MNRRVLLSTALTLPFLGAPAAACAQEAPLVLEIQEWQVPWERTRPRDPYVDPQGAVWFVGQAGHYVARLDPESGEFRRFELEAGAGPHNLIVDGTGTVWYAGHRSAHIGRLDPATGAIQRFTFADTTARDPHTLVFDADGNIWFTMQSSGFVGRLTPASGDIRLVQMDTRAARPYGIKVAADGRVWFNEFGVPRIGMIDPASFTLRHFDLPHERARGRRIEIGSDGGVWYVDYARGKLSRLDPETGTVEEFDAPNGANSLPYALAGDDRGRLWYVETGVQPNRFVGFDIRSRTVVATADVPSGGGTVRHMYFHAPTRTIWFGTDANTIGRARVPE
jgi:virginiamycin B lyase